MNKEHAFGGVPEDPNLHKPRCGAKLEPFVRPSEYNGEDVSIKCAATSPRECVFRATGYWLIRGQRCKFPREPL